MSEVKVKTLLLDIENAPSLGFYFDLWKEGNIIATEADWYILSYAWKWLGDKDVQVRALPDYPGYKRNMEDDKALCRDLWRLFDQADVVCAHNIRFDRGKSNARFVHHGFKPYSPCLEYDTLATARRYFKFTSNRLDDLSRLLKVGAKLPHQGVHTWRGCMLGDKKAWKTMRRYNAHDVVLLEGVYLALRAWGAHPNLSLITRNSIACPTCESTHTENMGWRYYSTGKKHRRRCKDCGRSFVFGKHLPLNRV